MNKLRRRQVQGLVEQQLPRRRGYQVIAANYLRDPESRIIYHHRQLVCWRTGGLPHDKIAADLAQVEAGYNAAALRELRGIATHPQSPRGRPRPSDGADAPA